MMMVITAMMTREGRMQLLSLLLIFCVSTLTGEYI